MALKITDESFRELIAGEVPVVVDFWAEWCGPCKMIGPAVEELAKEYEGQAIIGKINIDENVEVTDEFGIRSIPTLLFFKNGQLVDKVVGATSKTNLETKLKAIL
jgi:thioredoxin 1